MSDDKLIICRCEEVTLQTIKETVEKYQCSSREVKLRTRAGMGPCGGRTCRKMIDTIVQEYTKKAPGDEIPLSYRPPVRPITFGELGGAVTSNENP